MLGNPLPKVFYKCGMPIEINTVNQRINGTVARDIK